jgi:hypothetical protein
MEPRTIARDKWSVLVMATRRAELDIFALERLLESFATAALGLELKGRIEDLSSFPQSLGLSDASGRDAVAHAAWHTDRGVAALRAVCDEAQSLRAMAHVIKIVWWIGVEHHDGWWHCYPKFPRDWIKGIGRP